MGGMAEMVGKAVGTRLGLRLGEKEGIALPDSVGEDEMAGNA